MFDDFVVILASFTKFFVTLFARPLKKCFAPLFTTFENLLIPIPLAKEPERTDNSSELLSKNFAISVSTSV